MPRYEVTAHFCSLKRRSSVEELHGVKVGLEVLTQYLLAMLVVFLVGSLYLGSCANGLQQYIYSYIMVPSFYDYIGDSLLL